MQASGVCNGFLFWVFWLIINVLQSFRCSVIAHFSGSEQLGFNSGALRRRGVGYIGVCFFLVAGHKVCLADARSVGNWKGAKAKDMMSR
jgi:hypothetical protein